MEELFDVIHEVHIEKGHSGRDIMQKHMATRFSNVTTDHINIYRSFCEKCGLKKSKARRGVVVKPILTPNVMSRGQVDLIDMQVKQIFILLLLHLMIKNVSKHTKLKATLAMVLLVMNFLVVIFFIKSQS